MKYRLGDILWLFALFGSAMTAFGLAGLLVALLIVLFWIWIWAIKNLKGFIWWLSLASACLALLGLLVPATKGAYRHSYHNRCRHCMSQLAGAILTYQKDHGTFPPAYQLGPDGKPWHSWRVLILPYMDGKELYDAYNFDEPWDGPNNRKLWNEIPNVYKCRGCARANELGLIDHPNHCTNYFAIVGEDTAWPGSQGKKLDDIEDKPSETLLLLEAMKPVCWMEPTDLSPSEAREVLTKGSLPGHVRFTDGYFASVASSSPGISCFCSGGVEYSRTLISESFFRKILTANGGETVEDDAKFSVDYRTVVLATSLNWKNVYSFSFFVLLSLMPIRKAWTKSPSRKKS